MPSTKQQLRAALPPFPGGVLCVQHKAFSSPLSLECEVTHAGLSFIVIPIVIPSFLVILTLLLILGFGISVSSGVSLSKKSPLSECRAEYEASLDHYRATVLEEWLELPLRHRAHDLVAPLGRSADDVNVLHAPVGADNDPRRDRLDHGSTENGLDLVQHVGVAG